MVTSDDVARGDRTTEERSAAGMDRAGVDNTAAVPTDEDASRAHRLGIRPLRNGAIAMQCRHVRGTSRGERGRCLRPRQRAECPSQRQLLQLLAEVPAQGILVLVRGGKVAERFQLLLERQQAGCIGLIEFIQRDCDVLEVCVDQRPPRRLELSERRLELLGRVHPDLGPEQHHEHVAALEHLVVFVLQPGLRHRVDEVFPDHQLQEHAALVPTLVLPADEDLELAPVLDQLGRRGQKDMFLVACHVCSPPFVESAKA
jgi:hypothetical protein